MRPARLRPRLADEAAKAPFMRDLVRRIWGEAGSCFGTLAGDYLRSREIELDDDLTPRVLRFHPRCQFGPKAQAEFHPALLAAFTPIEGAVGDDNPVSLHRIGLTPNAKKIGKGMALGSSAGCVIRLSADEDVDIGDRAGRGAGDGPVGHHGRLAARLGDRRHRDAGELPGALGDQQPLSFRRQRRKRRRP